MSIAHLLEDFGTRQGAHTVSMTDISLEDQKLESFETGYKAGWDDAVKAQGDDNRRIASDFANNLQDLSFTYQEAWSDMLAALRPLLSKLVEAVLPELAHQTLGVRVIDMLHDMARNQGKPVIEIVTAPGNLAALEDLIGAQAQDLSVTLTSEPSLGEGQVHVRCGAAEQEIDLDSVLTGISDSLAGFFIENKKETA